MHERIKKITDTREIHLSIFTTRISDGLCDIVYVLRDHGDMIAGISKVTV